MPVADISEVCGVRSGICALVDDSVHSESKVQRSMCMIVDVCTMNMHAPGLAHRQGRIHALLGSRLSFPSLASMQCVRRVPHGRAHYTPGLQAQVSEELGETFPRHAVFQVLPQRFLDNSPGPIPAQCPFARTWRGKSSSHCLQQHRSGNLSLPSAQQILAARSTWPSA